ncbi:MAG: retropepsin-like aspartic protease [Pirellulales bacterium]
MKRRRPLLVTVSFAAICALAVACRTEADSVPLGGFMPLVGIGLTNQFETFDSDPDGTFFLADPSFSWGGTPLGPGGSPYFDLALLDTGAATHILTQAAAGNSAFNIDGPYSGESDGFHGTNFQTLFGASGVIQLRITDPLGIYAAGLADRTGAGAALTMNTSALRGQTSVAILEADSAWKLPNVLGLPMAAHHAIAIRNDEPQIFQLQGRTVRTPNIDFIDLGSGADEGILRRTDLRLRPSASFIQGPLYVQNLDIFSLEFHENPLSPTVVDSGGLFVEVDLTNGTQSFQDKELLFDTGADMTVLSQVTAKRLGFDALVDEPDFVLHVEGAGGVEGGVPGFYLDELNIDTVGGSFTLQNVPVAVLNLPNPNDPANVLDGILGMHLFNGRNIVIDANPAASSSGGGPPSLYISDPVTETHTWVSLIPQTSFEQASNWSASGTPNVMWDAVLHNNLIPAQFVQVSQSTTVFQLNVGASAGRNLQLQLTGPTLTVFGEVKIEEGGEILMLDGTLDAQVVNIEGGQLRGRGDIFVGSGPFRGVVRNLAGRVDPGTVGLAGELSIDGDYSQLAGGTLAIDLRGTIPVTQYDRLAVDRFAFLAGTLEVSLLGFTPGPGAMFTILTTGEGVFGEFDNLALPSGFQWDITYGANDVVLTVVSAGLAGDFNGDGSVDVADYVSWRKNGGTQGDYLAWRSNFGMTSSGGGSANASAAGVPEPGIASLIALAACGLACGRQRVTRHARCATSTSCEASCSS